MGRRGKSVSLVATNNEHVRVINNQTMVDGSGKNSIGGLTARKHSL